MSFPAVIQLLLPALIPIAIGYVVARWAGISMQPIATLLRTVFLPVILFSALRERMPFATFLLLVLIGAVMALAGMFLVRHAHRFLRPKVDRSAAVLNIACFSLPLFALSWASNGLATGCALFVGVAVAFFAVEVRSARALLGEPWAYAVVAAFVFRVLGVSAGWMDHVVSPLASSAFILLLLYLGAALHPWASFKNADAWATVAVRLVSGVGVGALAVAVLPISGTIAQGVVLTALAPPATGMLALSVRAPDSASGRAAATLGTLASLLLIGGMLVAGWPWRL
jgi:hypothetical protein